jgi:hypothetical protein
MEIPIRFQFCNLGHLSLYEEKNSQVFIKVKDNGIVHLTHGWHINYWISTYKEYEIVSIKHVLV